MSERKETTEMLSLLLENTIDPKDDPRVYWAKEVTFDYATGNSVRVDYMLYKPKDCTVSGLEKGDFYCFEIKSSVEDFHSPHGHNFMGDLNYYVTATQRLKGCRLSLLLADAGGGLNEH